MFSEFKKKYIKNTYLYDLYRSFRYGTYHKAYSFWAEDFWVDKATANIDNGTYVDVGCNHPVLGSITYRLFQRNWSGVNIDFDKKNIDLCKKYRPHDKSFCCPISDNEADVDCYSFDAGNVLNTLDKDAADEWAEKMGKPYNVHTMKTRTLNGILKEAGIQSIDFLNIDVEGFEDQVFKGFDLSIYTPKLIACEIHIVDLREMDKSWSYNHLIENGYTPISKIGPTCMFKRNDCDDIFY